MRVSIKLALGASILGLAAPAGAATFFFSSGAYNPGVTSPNPLLAPDVLEIGTVATKSFATDFTNQSGTVNWRDGGAIFWAAALRSPTAAAGTPSPISR